MRIPILLSAALSAGLIALSAQASDQGAKVDYCNTQDYYSETGANDAKAYPRLHCGYDFVTYDKSPTDHYKFYKNKSVNRPHANAACYKSRMQGATHLIAKVKEICDANDALCSECE